MNVIGLLVIAFAIVYVAYLCFSPFAFLQRFGRATTPLEILNACIAARRHYGLQAVCSFFGALVLLAIKAGILLMGSYDSSGVFTRLAFGTIDGDLVLRLGILPILLMGISTIEAVFFVKWNAFVRIMFVLRNWLNLDLQLISDEDQRASSGSPHQDAKGIAET